jgi:hypothetical protein
LEDIITKDNTLIVQSYSNESSPPKEESCDNPDSRGSSDVTLSTPLDPIAKFNPIHAAEACICDGQDEGITITATALSKAERAVCFGKLNKDWENAVASQLSHEEYAMPTSER